MLIFIAIACSHENDSEITRDISIDEVRNHYQNKIRNPNVRSNAREEIEILWGLAQYLEIEIGDALVFPLARAEDRYIGSNSSGIKVNATDVSMAFAYKRNDSVHFEMIEQIPTKVTDNFTGYTLVKDWEGNVLRFFEYHNGMYTQELEVVQDVSTARTICTATDYYSCTKRANGNDDCTLDKTVITCVQQKELSPPDLDGSQYPNGGSSATSCGSGYELNYFGECIRIMCEPGYVLVGENCVPQIERCDTGNNLIDNNHLADVLPILWEASNPNAPLDQRFEQGAWIVMDDFGQFKAVPLVNFITTPCGLAPPENWRDDIPENAVAWLHTHPFYSG